MKIRTSVTVDKRLLDTVDKLSGKNDRSHFIEAALRAYVAHLIRHKQNAKDLAVINERADELNEEALDVLDYQVAL
jgi:metal-responsive CopG/Arc/MetJ family transcriptional regulator